MERVTDLPENIATGHPAWDSTATQPADPDQVNDYDGFAEAYAAETSRQRRDAGVGQAAAR